MSERTGIAWTDHTFNPWWGCVKVSPGCANCYAEGEAHRRGFAVWGPKADRRGFSAAHWKEPERWNRAAEKEGRRHRVFCASMADVFEDLDPPRDGGDLRSYDMEARRFQLWDLIARTPWLDWQLLTKRPENIRRFLPKVWLERPMPNVWLGTSAEDQERLEQRLPHLMALQAAVRFLSFEPLLGPIDLWGALSRGNPSGFLPAPWLIVGGESGPKARDCDVAWVRSLRDQGKGIGAAVFVKQLGARVCEYPEDCNEADLDGEPQDCLGHWIPLKDRKGADPAEWPEDLRVQEFPR